MSLDQLILVIRHRQMQSKADESMAEHGVALLLRCRMLHTSALMHGEVAVVLVVARCCDFLH